MGNRLSQKLDLAEILVAGIAPRHPLENPIRPGLDWQVELRANRLLLRHGRDEFPAQIVGVRRREAHAAHARSSGDGAQQPGEIPIAVAIGVHSLAEQRELA